jgi:hypothetical protein
MEKLAKRNLELGLFPVVDSVFLDKCVVKYSQVLVDILGGFCLFEALKMTKSFEGTKSHKKSLKNFQVFYQF